MPAIVLGDLELHYEACGQGEPLLLLHGSFSTARHSFGTLMPMLARERLVLAPDFRGHGQTRCPSLAWDVPQLAVDMLDFLSALGIASCPVAGHSMGGDCVMIMATLAPSRVASLLAIGTAGARNPGLVPYLEKFAPHNAPETRYPRFIRALKERHALAHRGDWQALVRATIQTCMRYPDFSDQELARLAMPFLLLHGDQDPFVSEGEVERLSRLCPRFERVLLAGQGHSPHQGAGAEAAAGIMLRFLADATGSGKLSARSATSA